MLYAADLLAFVSIDPIKSVDPTLLLPSGAGTVVEIRSSLGISIGYIGIGVLVQLAVLFGVLAQVTKLKPTGAIRSGF